MWYFTVFTQYIFLLNYIFPPLRTHTSSPIPMKPSQSSHHEALTAVEAISQLHLVKSKTGIINHQETEEQQHKQQDYSPQVYGFTQNRHIYYMTYFDSLCDFFTYMNEYLFLFHILEQPSIR